MMVDSSYTTNNISGFSMDDLRGAVAKIKEINKRYRDAVADTFAVNGIEVIPDDSLMDNQYKVSRALYECIKARNAR